MNLSELDVNAWCQLDWDALADRPAGVRRAAILGLGVLAALLPGLLGGWWLTDDRAAEAGREQVLRAQLAPKRAAAAGLPALRRQQAELDQTLAALAPTLADAGGASALWQQVQARALEQSLQLDTLEPGTPVVQPNHTVLPATLRLRGNYAQLVRFAASLASSTPAVNLRRWTLRPGADGRLSADMTLEGYQRLGDASPSQPVPASLPSVLPLALTQALAQLADPFAAPPAKAAEPPLPFQRAASRPPGPLQAVPLQDITLVGTLAQGAATVALLQVGGRVYPARVGDAVGDLGEVLRIEADSLVLRDWARQPGGAWVPRELRLAVGGRAS